jgi:predicted CoA-binding protein
MDMMEASEREQLLRIYAETRTIAVVGASADESKAAHQVPLYLQRQGRSPAHSAGEAGRTAPPTL